MATNWHACKQLFIDRGMKQPIVINPQHIDTLVCCDVAGQNKKNRNAFQIVMAHCENVRKPKNLVGD